MLSIDKLVTLKFTSGPVQFLPTNVTNRGFDCICAADLSSHKNKKFGISCTDRKGEKTLLTVTLTSVTPQNGVYMVSLELDEQSFYSLTERTK